MSAEQIGRWTSVDSDRCVTAPEAITPRRQAEAIAAALGSPVRFHELTRDEAKTAMTQSMPAELADDTLGILGSPSLAELRVGPDVQQVLGRAPSPTGPPAMSPRSAETGRRRWNCFRARRSAADSRGI